MIHSTELNSLKTQAGWVLLCSRLIVVDEQTGLLVDLYITGR